MDLSPCPECGNLVSRLAASCPKCGRPYPLRKRTSKAAQFAAAINACIIGLLILGLGIMLATNANSRGEENAAATIFIPLGVAVVLIGVALLAYVCRRRDWIE